MLFAYICFIFLIIYCLIIISVIVVMSESRRNQSPRINESDYRAGDRNSVGKKRIFDIGESNPPTCWGCPRWGCLVVFFILFGIITGLTTWLIIKNETYNTYNPELKIQYDKIKEYNK